MKKAIVTILAAALLALPFGGCTSSDTGTDSGSSSPADRTESAADSATGADITIGIIQMMEHPSLDTIRESFLAEMDRLGYGNVNFDYKDGQGDMNNLNTISQGFVGNEVDVIVAIATPAAVAAAGTTTEIPIIFSAVTDPIAANLLSDMNSPDGNVTGVSDAIPVESIFGIAKELTPDAKTFGFVYNLGEVNSVSVINDAKAYCDANGLEYLEATVTNTSEVQQAAQSLVGRVDAYFSPIDNTVASAMPVFAQVAIDNNLPIYPGADSMVEDGGLATVGIDYTVLGAETAKMVVEYLEGAQISDMPVVIMENFRAIANQDTADAIGVDLSGLSDVEIFSAQ